VAEAVAAVEPRIEAASEGPPPTALARLLLREDLNFLVTNRIPRRLVTRAMGRVCGIRSKRFTQAALGVWRLFADDLRLDEAEHTDFGSLQECFTRSLRPGMRPIAAEPEAIVSPCDAVIGASGVVERGLVYQAKGFPYRLDELVPDPAIAAGLEGGRFVTLRLKSNMYHRFHAPSAGSLDRVLYVSGDTWNVNPIALRRVERLFCRNERVVFDIGAAEALCRPGGRLVLVAVAAIGVATVRVHALGARLDLRHRGPNEFRPDVRVTRGEELGFFEAGSTIVLFAAPGCEPWPGLREGQVIRMGRPLLRAPRGAT
jgi:phosphatidylserine decarboxylase